mmetsp:Transcript_40365/g.45043  ORF Transcript_40365/g.45043 Transcript_40365/m.45043 type:complete len:110 (+) Transcript_40365:110-439(+)
MGNNEEQEWGKVRNYIPVVMTDCVAMTITTTGEDNSYVVNEGVCYDALWTVRYRLWNNIQVTTVTVTRLFVFRKINRVTTTTKIVGTGVESIKEIFPNNTIKKSNDPNN